MYGQGPEIGETVDYVWILVGWLVGNRNKPVALWVVPISLENTPVTQVDVHADGPECGDASRITKLANG
jgi:hypothetical protein